MCSIIMYNQLIPKLIRMISHACGEPLARSVRWYRTYLQAHRRQFRTWPKPTGPPRCIPPSGLGPWSIYWMSLWWWTQIWVLGMAQQQGVMGIWVTREPTSCEPTESAHCPNGLMTPSSSRSQRSVWRNTMIAGKNGPDASRSMEGTSRKDAGYGTREVIAQMAPGKNLMRTSPSGYRTYQTPLIAHRRISCSLTPCRMSMCYLLSWASLGNFQKMSHSPQPLPTSALFGTWQ